MIFRAHKSAQIEFNPRLESLRGLAAFAVLMTHCMGTFTISGEKAYWVVPFLKQPFETQALTMIGGIFNPNGAVVFFFILSGYVLTLSLLRSKQPLIGQFLPYLIRRFFRLFPAMWFSILAIAALRLLLPDTVAPPQRSGWYESVFGGALTVKALARNAALIDFSVNPVTWTIYVEAVGSILLPFLVEFTRKKQMAVGLLPLIGLTFASCFTSASDEALRYIFCFQIGVILACKKDKIGTVKQPVAILLSGIALFFIQRIMMLNSASGTIIEAIGATAILISVLHAPSTSTFRWLDHPVMRLTGWLSYGIYLFHIVAIYGVAQLLSAQRLSGSFPVTACLMVTATACLTLPISWLAYRGIEYPLIKYGRFVSNLLYCHVYKISRQKPLVKSM